MRHPEAVFDRPVESAVIDPTNPFVLGPHLTCAAAEHHLTSADLDLFGGRAARTVLDQLVERRVLRRRPGGFFWASPGHPAERVDLRGSGAGQVSVVDRDSCRLLGTVDAHRATSAVHTGAVHLHRGESYVVDELDLDGGVAFVRAARPEWTTVPRSVSTVSMTGAHRSRTVGPGIQLGVGPVELTTQVVGYLRRRPDGELLDQVELDLPRHTATRAVWYAIEPESLRAAGIRDADVPARCTRPSTAIGLLPLFAGCDRWTSSGPPPPTRTPETDRHRHDGHRGAISPTADTRPSGRGWRRSGTPLVRPGRPSCAVSAQR